jgi:hypothetical protein
MSDNAADDAEWIRAAIDGVVAVLFLLALSRSDGITGGKS